MQLSEFYRELNAKMSLIVSRLEVVLKHRLRNSLNSYSHRKRQPEAIFHLMHNSLLIARDMDQMKIFLFPRASGPT